MNKEEINKFKQELKELMIKYNVKIWHECDYIGKDTSFSNKMIVEHMPSISY